MMRAPGSDAYLRRRRDMENNDTQRIPAQTASDAADPQRLNCGGDIIWCIIENGPAAPVERLSRRRRGPVFWAGTSRKLCGCADARNTPIRRSLMAALPNDWLAREQSGTVHSSGPRSIFGL